MPRKKAKHFRGNGHGTLERRSNGIYIARWMVHGQKFSRTTGTTDKDQAERKLEEFTKPTREKTNIEILENLAARIRVGEAAAKEAEDNNNVLKVFDAFDVFNKSVSRKESSQSTTLLYERDFGVFEKWLKKNEPHVEFMKQITRKIAQSYLEHLNKTVSNSTYNIYLTMLKYMWKILIIDGRLNENVWATFKKKNAAHSVRRELTFDEVRRLLQCAEDDEMKTLISISVYTGLRMSDCCDLTWDRIDMEKKIIRVLPIKTRSTGRWVRIPIHRAFYTILNNIPSEKRNGFVVPKMKKLYSKGLIQYWVKKAFNKAKIKMTRIGEDGRTKVEASFHSLRHTFVSIAANAGIPLSIVQAIVGHASSEMTEHYFHENDEQLIKCVESIPDIIPQIECRPTDPEVVEADVVNESITLDSDVLQMISSLKIENETACETLRRVLAAAKHI